MVNPQPPLALRLLLGRRLSAIALHAPPTLYANLAYRFRGWHGVPYRTAYYLGGNWLRRRDPIPAQRVTISGDAAADLAQAAQRADSGEANIVIAADGRPAMPLLSALLMSNSVCDIDVEFDGQPASGPRGDLKLPPDFLSHQAFDHNVNRFLKVAHPGALVVAISLAPSADGFCDEAFATWRGALAAFAAERPDVALVLLNPIGPALARSEFIGRRGPVYSARLAGLSQAETLRLAQTADAFIGPLDAYGLVARAAGRPGGYLEESQSPQSALEQLRALLRQPSP